MIYGDILKYGQAILKKYTKSKRCLLYLILFRLINCLVVRTSFFPDEYAQSIEISHYWVFGYGHKPWEWESCISLRSVVHPFTYAILFYLLKITKLDTPLAVLYAPRIFQGLCAALGDYGMIKLVTLWYAQLYRGVDDSDVGSQVDNRVSSARGLLLPVHAILTCYFLFWFHFYTICRTSSQSFECILNIWGVYFISRNYFPFVPTKGEIALLCLSESVKDKQNNQSKGVTTVVRRAVLPMDERLVQKCNHPSSIIRSDAVRTCSPSDEEENGRILHSGRGEETYNQGDTSTTGYYPILQCDDHKIPTSVDKFKTVQTQNLLLSLLCSSFCVLIRPNAAPFWLCIYFLYLVKCAKGHKTSLQMEEVLKIGIVYTLVFFLLGMVADSYYYKKITITFLNFFLYNFVSGQNSYFGEHPIHFYLSCVIPSIYLLFTPFTYYTVFYLMRNVTRERRSPLDAVINRIDYSVYMATLLEILSLSLSVHKEHKLLIGYMPFITICTGLGIHKCWMYVQEATRKKKKKFFFFFLNIGFLLHMMCTFFFSRVHNSSAEKVATYFRNLKTVNDKEVTILMTDCYDTPLYSHIHRQFKIGFLDCSPHIRKQNGHILQNWRKKIYDNNFGNVFYDLFDETKRTPESVQPYIIPDKNFHWFGHKNFNRRKHFKWVYEKINFSCLHYRFSVPLNGDLPLYLVTTSDRLSHLAPFLSQFNYHLDVDPIFSHYTVVQGGMKLGVVNHLIFKRGST
ncbi:GPI mannosyltransferase 3, putative [Plasmodium knowlesi strain H]|uniref:Mannosyltransferase n=3 Tax=Plasmodium knowlesi TaxID=5850 RepID=A0A5K1VB46_PLAKH|nr:GPI mannosyltransferase 3, putative [Plasmodium knowlesi strain H]OTN66195.1 Mannosyltransferase [Plasmodium knowlesi]CAA9989923.1 GPI mannosyltransferase 3, putative [Plasmodium knowlesi strain H]SBO24495.1 GPI mannosyltransferase 3, putative [Plasmodium knowlesi strain H]SBO26460.1 GPI mannosyltransferase 3, putative [Plasmodium knowlesi strain H]VVS79397.1 GPI mannosyltransferase 3, putative [Plasmodium knowlesi strain H]|eukprot:XP_002259939.1 mannosyltransferase, putative [Plasmodium knowlesi strain H]